MMQTRGGISCCDFFPYVDGCRDLLTVFFGFVFFASYNLLEGNQSIGTAAGI